MFLVGIRAGPWDLGGSSFASSIIPSSCYKQWDSGGGFLHLEDMVKLVGRGGPDRPLIKQLVEVEG